jgi:hypothetical protein
MVLKFRNNTIAFFATLILILISTTVVSAIPLTPMSIQGDVTIDGNLAPAGTVVTAEMDGVQVDTYTVQSTGQYMLTIEGESTDAGKIVEFFVNGENTHNTQNWVSGAIVTIDLAISTYDDSSNKKSSSSFTSSVDTTSENNSTHRESLEDGLPEPETGIDEQAVISDNDSDSSAENRSTQKAIPGFTSITLIIGLIVSCIGANKYKKE